MVERTETGAGILRLRNRVDREEERADDVLGDAFFGDRVRQGTSLVRGLDSRVTDVSSRDQARGVLNKTSRDGL